MYSKNIGFTLAELLIALAILGVIATFTIPKILDSGSSSEWNAKAMEFSGMLTESLQVLKLNGSLSASSGVADLTQYFNYVKYQTTGSVDSHPNDTAWAPTLEAPCSGAYSCIQFHNGAAIQYRPTNTFGDTSSTSAIWFMFDPDGKYSGSATGAGKSVQFWLYYNGRLVTRQSMSPNTYYDGGAGPLNAVANAEPPWFSWGGS